MCGIFGSIGLEPDPARIDIVAHRGLDGRGWTVQDSRAGKVALGHRRLAIIDVSDDGLQPMTLDGGRYEIVFNGEIYNYLELRAELERKGVTFRTRTDTEILMRALIVWGMDALPRLRGMFAFLFWDKAEQTLVAARDRFGIKPLYYAAGPRSIAFGSEIKQLIGLPGVTGRMNFPRVADFLISGLSDHTAETMFEGVNQLRAGECALIGAGSDDGPSLELRRWYQPPPMDMELGAKEASHRFHELLAVAVKLHLRSDVPVGSCLSGGLDSSSIVCIMAEQLGSSMGGPQVKTISACYPDKYVDEKPFMDTVVAHAHTEPTYVWPRAEDVFQRASDITWHQDEPFGSTSIFAQWCVFEAAKNAGVKVMLDGQGADEQLAGYTTGFAFHLAGLIRRGHLIEAVRSIEGRQRLSGASYARQLVELAPQLLPRSVVSELVKRRRRALQHDWIGEAALASCASTSAFETAIEKSGLPAARDLASLCATMTFASNLQMLLHWEDRNSMAHGIEARVPFLDHPLVEFSLGLGNHHKMVGGATKSVLRSAMAGVLPRSILDRHDKLGFATPEQNWFRGPLRGLIEDGIESTLQLYPDLMNAKGVRSRSAAMLDGRAPIDFWLWRVVNLGIWGKRFGIGY
jgi:asparagine synthase (glutamine-hydrolysing)